MHLPLIPGWRCCSFADHGTMFRRLENVEAEVQRLREQLSNVNELLLRQSTQQQQQIAVTSPASAHVMSDPGTMPTFLATGGMGGYHHWRGARCPMTRRDHDAGAFQFPTPGMEAARPTRLRRSGFDIKEEPVLDFISRGMMTADQAMSCFRTYVAVMFGAVSWCFLICSIGSFKAAYVVSFLDMIFRAYAEGIRIGISRYSIQISTRSTLCALGVAFCSMLSARLAVELRSVRLIQNPVE